MEQAEDIESGESLASTKEIEFDSKAKADRIATEPAHELECGFHGAASGEQIIDKQNALAGLDGVEVNFEGVGAVFEIVGDADHGRGQLARLAHGDKAGVEAVGERRAEDEAARFNAENEIDLAFQPVSGHGVGERGKSSGVFEQGGDVVKKYAGLGVIGHGADERFECFGLMDFLAHG